MLFPGTFTSLQEANGEGLGSVGAAVLGSIAHLPLCVVLYFGAESALLWVTDGAF